MNPLEVAQIQHLWDDFFNLNQIISKPPEDLTDNTIIEYEHKAREWGRSFINTYAESVTPYIHAFMNHVAEFMRLHGGILPYTQHGLEK